MVFFYHFIKVHIYKFIAVLCSFFQILSPWHRRSPLAFHSPPPLAGGLFFVPPCRMDLIKVFRQGTRRPPKPDASGFCRRYPLRLPLLYVFPLALGDKRQNLQNQISDKYVPSKSLPCRVSRSGISRTQISTPFSFVSSLHCS